MRIRSIKPEFWRSDDVTQLTREERLLFIGLWSYVDDNGVGVDDFRAIAADLFALEDDQKEVRDFIREGLATLSRVLLVVRYEVAGKRFIYIPSWDRHQRVDRPNKPRYPRPEPGATPPTSGNENEGELFATPSRHPRDTPSTGAVEQGNRGTEEQRKNPPAADAADPPKVGSRQRGRRIPEDFAVTDAMKTWARTNTPLVGQTETDLFVEYWQSESGAKASKVDWVKAWQVWMRREQKSAERRPAHLRAVPTPPPPTSFEDLRHRADAATTSRLLGKPYLPKPQPPSDDTPPRVWARTEALRFIDAHADALRTALNDRSSA